MNIEKLIKEHAESDKEAFNRIYEELNLIRENHLIHIQEDMSTLKSDVAWIKRFFWTIFAGVFAAIVEIIHLHLGAK